MEGFVGSTVWSGDWSQKFPINPGLAAGGGVSEVCAANVLCEW